MPGKSSKSKPAKTGGPLDPFLNGLPGSASARLATAAFAQRIKADHVRRGRLRGRLRRPRRRPRAPVLPAGGGPRRRPGRRATTREGRTPGQAGAPPAPIPAVRRPARGLFGIDPDDPRSAVRRPLHRQGREPRLRVVGPQRRHLQLRDQRRRRQHGRRRRAGHLVPLPHAHVFHPRRRRHGLQLRLVRHLRRRLHRAQPRRHLYLGLGRSRERLGHSDPGVARLAGRHRLVRGARRLGRSPHRRPGLLPHTGRRLVPGVHLRQRLSGRLFRRLPRLQLGPVEDELFGASGGLRAVAAGGSPATVAGSRAASPATSRVRTGGIAVCCAASPAASPSGGRV